jgi:hypothetical protein
MIRKFSKSSDEMAGLPTYKLQRKSLINKVCSVTQLMQSAYYYLTLKYSQTARMEGRDQNK